MDVDLAMHRLASDPHASVDLAELALCLARDEYARLDVEGYLGELDALAQDARNYVRGPFTARVDGLCRYVFHELGFRGNKKDYYDTRNSYLNQVLDRRTGIPITLAAVLMALGRRIGVRVEGVGLPGHFVVKCVDEDGARPGQEIVVDPFHGGRRLSLADCEILVRQTTGAELQIDAEHLQPIPLGRMIERMLNNLRAIYLGRVDWPRSLRILGRLAQLVPDDPTLPRDFGICYLNLGEPGRALDCFAKYLRHAGAAADSADVDKLRQQALREIARWN